MSAKTEIEWADRTWNPVRGCTKVSPGCKNCYAERFAERFRGVPGHPYEQGFDLRLVPESLYDPFDWLKPSRVFVNSMSDLFQDGVPDEYVRRVADVMEYAGWHSYMVLTKREERLERLLAGPLASAAARDNVLWGVSVEDRRYGLPRIEALRRSPARHRFLSAEPLLEDLGELDLRGIGWVIAGGESGPGCRPVRPEWVRSLRDQCAAAGAAFFFKQWGGEKKSATGRELDGAVHSAYPTELFPVPVSREGRDHWEQRVRRVHGAPGGRRIRLTEIDPDQLLGC